MTPEQSEIAKLREILAFDCTGFPSMEQKAIEWANKISGPLGGAPFHPDPIGILEMCEDIAKAALADLVRDMSSPELGADLGAGTSMALAAGEAVFERTGVNPYLKEAVKRSLRGEGNGAAQ